MPYVRRWCLRAAAAFRVVPCSGSRGAVDGAVDVRRNAATTSGRVDNTVAVLPDDGSTRHGYTVAMRFTVARPRRNRETLNRHTKHPRGAEEAGMICMAAACDLLLRVVVLVGGSGVVLTVNLVDVLAVVLPASTLLLRRKRSPCLPFLVSNFDRHGWIAHLAKMRQ